MKQEAEDLELETGPLLPDVIATSGQFCTCRIHVSFVGEQDRLAGQTAMSGCAVGADLALGSAGLSTRIYLRK